MLKNYFKSESGATAIEYGLIAAAVAVALAATVFVFGDELETLLTNLTNKLSGANAELAG